LLELARLQDLNGGIRHIIPYSLNRLCRHTQSQELR